MARFGLKKRFIFSPEKKEDEFNINLNSTSELGRYLKEESGAVRSFLRIKRIILSQIPDASTTFFTQILRGSCLDIRCSLFTEVLKKNLIIIIEISYNINRPFCYSFDEGNSGDDNPTTVIHRAVDNLFTAIKIVAEPVARVH